MLYVSTSVPEEAIELFTSHCNICTSMNMSLMINSELLLNELHTRSGVHLVRGCLSVLSCAQSHQLPPILQLVYSYNASVHT